MSDLGIYTVTEDEYYRVEIHENPSMMYVFWKRHIEGDLLKEKFMALLGIIKRFKPLKWLGNAKATYYTTVQDAKWLFSSFVPILIGSSVRRYARVEANNSLMILDSMKLHDTINNLNVDEIGEFKFKFFTEEEPALEWLHSKP
jgi:hypothetical protein